MGQEALPHQMGPLPSHGPHRHPDRTLPEPSPRHSSIPKWRDFAFPTKGLHFFSSSPWAGSRDPARVLVTASPSTPATTLPHSASSLDSQDAHCVLLTACPNGSAEQGQSHSCTP